MAARIKRDFHFFANIYLENQFKIDFLTITVYMDVLSNNSDVQHIAFERLKYLYLSCLDNCLIVNENEKKIIETFTNLGIKVCTLPTDPYDQAIAITLLHKMTAICENKLVATNLIFKSHLSEGIEYLVDIEESYGNFDVKTNNWWHENGPNVSNKKPNKKEKIVQLQKNGTDWADIGLGWKKITKPENQIIFTLDTEKS